MFLQHHLKDTTHKKDFFEKVNLTELQRPFYSITGNFCEAISRQREFLTLKWKEQFTGYPAYCTKLKSHAGI